jgi:hypothetical protein
MKLRVLVAVLIVAAAVASWQLLQQTEPIVLPTPARILARMVLIEGDVKLRKAGTLGWILPALPAPLQTNDSIRTRVRVDPEGRAVEPPRDALLEALSPLPLSLSVLELKGNQLYVKGRTDRGATVTVNGERLTVQRDGSFDEHVVLEEHVLEVVIRATGLDGAATEQRVPVSRLLLRRL